MRPFVHLDDHGKVHRSKVSRVSACGKQAYSSRKLAKGRAATQAKATGEPIEAYKCTAGCHCWHIGHPRGWRKEHAA